MWCHIVRNRCGCLSCVLRFVTSMLLSSSFRVSEGTFVTSHTSELGKHRSSHTKSVVQRHPPIHAHPCHPKLYCHTSRAFAQPHVLALSIVTLTTDSQCLSSPAVERSLFRTLTLSHTLSLSLSHFNSLTRFLAPSIALLLSHSLTFSLFLFVLCS